MLSVLKAQVTNLDSSKYKVMLVWDPDNARDVGWMTVEKDMKVDLEALQVRDVNLDKISLCSMSKPEASKQNNETKGNTAEEDNQEMMVIQDAMEVNVREAKCTKTNMLDEVDLLKGKVQCSECELFLLSNNLPRHMTIVHQKVKCAICGVYLNKVNLEFHKKLKHSSSRAKCDDSSRAKCDDCGKTFKSERGLTRHRRWYINSRSKCSKNGGSTAHNDIPERKVKKEGVVKTILDNDVSKQIRSERVDFSIILEGRGYSCSRSKGAQIKGSLKKFCKHVGKDLKFEFEGRFLTGAEIVDTFADGKILASLADHM